MLERFSRSWELFTTSAQVLASDRKMPLFPVASMGALAVLVVVSALPALQRPGDLGRERDRLRAEIGGPGHRPPFEQNARDGEAAYAAAREAGAAQGRP